MTILISYRNEDSPMLSNQLHTSLAQRMGARNFIFGVNSLIDPGDIVADAIKDGVQKCDILMVFIGQNWAQGAWSQNANDPDVLAIATAQATGKRVIPVYLMDGFQ
ncbi:MAG: TIR domain-containing protein, partial [Phototrophicales bacterium]|nr:TIR domain-containing protein [Phototrophicales bacterium]